MIVSGGENVYCTEVEDALYTHPHVLEATVSMSDDQWGEAVPAVVVLRDSAAGNGAALRAHCRTLIAGHEVPKVVQVRAEPLPRSGPGKVLKRVLREPYWIERDRSIN